MRPTFRNKVIGSFLLVIAATGGIATVMGAYSIGDRFVEQAQAKVDEDINTARVMYEHEIERVRNVVRMTADRPSIRDGLRGRDTTTLARLLARVREHETMDVLTLTDASGTVVVRARSPHAGRTSYPLVKEVLSRKTVVAGTQIVPADELLKESPELLSRATIRILSTPRARPTTAVAVDSGMMIMAAAPVLAEDERLVGVLYGGRLLNRSETLVDRIKDAVYKGEIYQGIKIGTVTIFQGDVRIATNVRRLDGQRAIGTRIQAEVGDRVLLEGKPWTERAFVVNGWYLTAYEPIRDIADRVIGILYVGMREDKFVDLKRQTVLAFLAITIAGMMLAAVIGYFVTRSVLEPVQRLVLASQDISRGEFDRVVPETSRDEIGCLEHAFNSMTTAIRERDRKLRDTMEARLFRSAHLASLGQLAASVAHELNNPLAGILIYLRLLRKYVSMDPFPIEKREEITKYVKTMETETARCGRLVSSMLQLGRQPCMRIAGNSLCDLVEKSMVLLEYRFSLKNVTVVRKLDPGLPSVECDGEQIQQTIMGMLSNAFEAMPMGGTLTVEARACDGADQVQIIISDTGIGIPQANIPRLFDSFFTTKGEGKGVGLGLAIAQAIIERHHGKVEVRSEVGIGSTFIVTFPVRHRPSDETEAS